MRRFLLSLGISNTVVAFQAARLTRGLRRRLRPESRLRVSLFQLGVIICFGLMQAAQMQGQGRSIGTISGKITDTAGAIVVGADLTLTSDDEGLTRSLQSNERGEFIFNDVPVATYSLRVSEPGFADFESNNISVYADNNIRVDCSLKPGIVSASITVNDNSGSFIDTRSATIGEVVDNKLVQDLPLDGGNTIALASLLPGVVNMNAPATFTGERQGPTYNVSGSRNTQNLMLLDGSMWNNLFFNSGLNYPPREGLQEVSVLLNQFKAEYGRNAGSVFNVITKGGGNQFHGTIWEYAENSAFNAADYMTRLNPKLVQNQFGGTVGGPVIKDKFFFFATFQNIRLAETATGIADVPSYAERGLDSDGTPLACSSSGAFAGQYCANFSADTPSNKTSSTWLKNPLYDVGKGYDPIVTGALNTAYQAAGGSLPGNAQSPCIVELNQAMATAADPAHLPNSELPAVCFNPVIVNVFNKFVPLPAATTGITGATATTTTAPYPRSEYDGMIRVDYVAGRNNISANYYISDNADRLGDGVSSSTAQGLAGYEILANSGTNNFGGMRYILTLSSNLFNMVNLSYKRYVNTVVPTDPTTLNQLGGVLQSFGKPTLPVFNFDTFEAGGTSGAYQHKVNEDIEADDTLTWSHGHHNIKTGASLFRLQYQNEAQYPGYIHFSTTFTGEAFADSLAGLVNSFEGANENNQAGIEHELFAFVQDDWRILSRLTFNLGARYELPFAWYQPKGLSATFIPGFKSTVFPSAPAGMAFVGDPGVPRALINTDFAGIAPRFGFAYDVFGNGRTALRGGFGVFHDAVNANVIGVGEPFYDRFTFASPSGGASEPMAGLPAVPTSYDPKNPQFVAPFSLFFPDKNFKTPYVIGFNFGLQQRLTDTASVEVNYVGKLGRHLTIPYDLNPAIYDCTGTYYQSNNQYCASSTNAAYAARVKYPGYNYGGQGLVDFASIGTSSYNGLQVLVNQRATRSLTLIGTYTYSRSLDEDTNGQNNNNEIPNVFDLKSEYGPSDYNVKHNGTAGWVYFIPKVRRGPAFEHAIINDWQFNGTYQVRTGLPFNPTINNDTALSGEPNQRPALLPGVNPLLSTNRSKAALTSEWFNTAAFAYPTLGTYSSLSRNKFVGPRLIQTNFTLGRAFPVPYREGITLAFRADAFNVFNMVNLANPNAEFSCSSTTAMTPCTSPTASSFFGRIQTTYGANSALNSNGRKLQLSLKLTY